ncbi:MAG: FKBP-type peptidyl-prolyl cis-trans isomerase [Bacteroidota bacterium]
MKIKYFILSICIAVCFTACKKNEPFNELAQFTTDTTAIRAFITSNNIPAIKGEYGVFYQIIEPGTGSFTYTSSTKVTVDYQGRLLNGTIFDDSEGTPRTFTLGGLIGGWQIGIPYIQKGGKIRLLIPSYYGYGSAPNGSIPANSVLDFTISLTNLQ